jgi:Fic family protein
MKLAYESLRDYMQRKINEKRQVSEFLKMEDVNDRQALILKWIYEEPALLLTARDVESRLGVSNQTARTDLQGLAKNGFLEEVPINKKTVAYGKGAAFDRELAGKLQSKGFTLRKLFKPGLDDQQLKIGF